MAPVEFDAEIANGTIEIPDIHRSELMGPVHVLVYPKGRSGAATKIDELIAHPLNVPGFRPLTRDESHERR